MYKKNLAMRAGVLMMAGALTFGSMPINVFADVHLVESEASSQYYFDNSVVTGKVIIDGVVHYIDSSKFNFTLSGSDGIVGIDESFLDREDDNYDIVTYNGKTYRIPNVSATINGADSWIRYQDNIYGTVISGYDPDATYTVEFTYELEEIVTSKALDVSVELDAWKYYSYGTWKNLNVKVNDNMTALSKDSATNITFSDGDVVKVLAGDSYELWTGTVSVNGGDVYFTGNSSAKSYKYNLVYEDGAVSFKEIGTGWGDAHGGLFSSSIFTYDFTAKADDGSPIAGISVTDDTALPYYEWFRNGFESGKKYTWGTGNSYTYTRDDGEETGTVTCSTDATGYTDMLVPIKNQSVINEYGANQFMSCNLQLLIETPAPNLISSDVYVGNGLIDFDTDSVDEKGIKENLTLDSLGVSTSLEKSGTSTVLGDYYSVVEASNRADTVTIKDTFGNEIGTVTMSVDSTDYLTDIDGTYSLVGKNLKGSVIPKATITMAEGVTDWRVSAEYETDGTGLYEGTFHITATKTNKADISVYDVYGAEVKGGVVDTSASTTIARFEEDYIEPNSSIEVSNKGEQTVDGVSYSPIVGEDLTVASKMRSVSSRIDAVTSDSVNVDIEPNGSYAVYFYYSSPKEAPKTYNLKVIDVYGSEEVVRDTKTVASGYAYSYDKNEKGTWKVTGTDSYAGTVTEDTTLYFYYTQPSVTEQVTIKVYDHFGETVEERVNKTVDKGTAYDYSSLTRDSWIATGTKNYSGTANEDVVLHFYYEMPAVEEKVNIKVIDVYPDGSITRVDKDEDKGTSYSYDSVNKDDFVVTGTSHYDGVLNKDTILYFYYERPAVEDKVNIKVIDHYPMQTVERVNEDRNKGTSYSYDADNKGIYTVVGTGHYDGTLNEDLVLHFYYEAPSVEEKVNIKVIDVYPDGSITRVDEDKDKGTSYSYDSIDKGDYVVTGTSHYDGVLTEDTVLYFYYSEKVAEKVNIRVYDHFGSDVEERVNTEVAKGTSYTYKSLSRDTWKVTGETHYNGVATKDVELHFYYVLPDEPTPTPDPEPTPTPDPEPTPTPDPEPTPTPDVPEPTPEIPSTPEPTPAPSQPSEPKTGETSSPYGALSLASILAFVVALTKKRK